jgi:hypothetical protein
VSAIHFGREQATAARASRHHVARRDVELFCIFCRDGDPSTLSLPADDATIAILTQKLADMSEWMWLSELPGVGVADRGAVIPRMRPNKVMLNIDGELQAIRPRTVFRGTVPSSAAHFHACRPIS